jgi:hypothetical protein
MLVLIITIEVFYLGSQSYSGVYFPVDQSGLALCGSAFAKTCKLRVLPFLFHPCVRRLASKVVRIAQLVGQNYPPSDRTSQRSSTETLGISANH